MENALQLAVITPVDDLRNREIKSNVKELLPIVQAKALEYKNTSYGIEQEKMCREHRATLNRFQTAIVEEVKEIGKANSEPFKRFEKEVQPIIDAVSSAIASLDDQLNEMETLWRTKNLENAKAMYDSIIGKSEFFTWLPWEKILITKKTARTTYEEFFGNKGSWNYPEEYTEEPEEIAKAGKKVCEALELFLKMAIEKNDVIDSLDYPEEIKEQGKRFLEKSYDPTRKGFDTDGAFSLMGDLSRREREKREAVEKAKREAEEKARREAEEAQCRAEAEKQRAIEEERRRAEEAQRKAVEEATRKAKEEAQIQGQMNVTDYIPNAEEKRYTLRFESEMTITQAKQLRAFCDSYGITLKQIK